MLWVLFRKGPSIEYPQHIFLWKNMKKISILFGLKKYPINSYAFNVKFLKTITKIHSKLVIWFVSYFYELPKHHTSRIKVLLFQPKIILIFLFILQENKYYWYSSEAPQWSTSNEYYNMFYGEIWEIFMWSPLLIRCYENLFYCL